MKRPRTQAQRDADARRTGRPPMPRRDRRCVVLMGVFTMQEARAVRAEARRRRLTVSELLAAPWREKKG